MSWVKNTFSSSIGRKFSMALSALFLLIFLLQHFAINLTSVISEDLFNNLSHFMGTNFIIQGIMQPVLIFGVIFHFAMGFVLEMKNKVARGPVKYAKPNVAANSSWMSRNMIYSGLVILAFLGLHFYDFWIHEITVKYIDGNMSGLDAHGNFRYFEELVAKFDDPIRVGIYCVSFIFLALHLMHGFQSAFQSIGARNPKYLPLIQGLGKAYAIIIPVGFVFIAIYHYMSNH
ncbi:MAG: succinate dehydrogenase cytochrome b subunit [Bacteroidetes bacterium]|nr:succinate dehydrogenase cytochrome b subunit [Bacteroidota bacterium]